MFQTSGLTSLRRAVLVRSEDSSSGESEEEEEAGWKYVVKYIILYCHLPCLVNIQLYYCTSCDIQFMYPAYIRIVFAKHNTSQ